MKTMKNLALTGAFCLALSACALPVSYIGDKYAPSNSVDIYYSAHDVKKDYKVIGHMSYQNIGFNTVKAKFQAYAKTIGADAIVITGTDATKNSDQAVINADALKYN